MKDNFDKSKQDIADLVMAKINLNQIKIRSKYLVTAEELGFKGVLFLNVFLGIFFINLVFFWLKYTENLKLFSFGNKGILAFLETIPYLWIIMSLGFFALAGRLLRKYDISYQKSYKFILVCLGLFMLGVGSVMAASDINESAVNAVAQGELKILKPFYNQNRIQNKHRVVGEITSLEDDNFKVVNDQEQIEVTVSEETGFGYQHELKKGDWVEVVGEPENKSMEAWGVRRIDNPEWQKNKGNTNVLPKQTGKPETNGAVEGTMTAPEKNQKH